MIEVKYNQPIQVPVRLAKFFRDNFAGIVAWKVEGRKVFIKLLIPNERKNVQAVFDEILK